MSESGKTAQQLLDEQRLQAPFPVADPVSAPIVPIKAPLSVRISGLSEEEVEVLRKTICKDLTNDELLLYLVRCHRKQLDPFDGAYVFVHFLEDGKTRDTSQGFVMGTKIDGMRALSRRTGQFKGIQMELLTRPSDDGKGAVVFGARCTIWRKDVELPFVEEALLSEYTHGRMWNRMPETMIRKVAESKALRAAFPGELAGIYEPAEMEQADRKGEPK